MTSSTALQQFEAYVGKKLVESKTPGMAVATAKEGKVDYAQGYGFRNKELGLPMKADTILAIGSVTKTFTCVAIMQLADRGLLSPHDPVIKHLPNFRLSDQAHAEKVTIHHLMTHTAGIPSLPYLARGMHHSLKKDPEGVKYFPFRWTPDDKPIDTYEEMMDVIATTDYALLDGPGTFFSYSNESYGLLGAIIEAASGQPYEDFVRNNVLQPTGLTDTNFANRDMSDLEARATELYCHDPELKDAVPTPGWWQSFPFSAAGFLYSTVLDLARFMDMFRTGGLVGDVRLLSEDSVAAMVTPHIPCGVGQFYGYGLMITPDYHGLTLIEHGGNIKGAAALGCCVPELGRTFAGVGNMSSSPTSRAMTGGVHAFANLPVDQSRIPSADYDIAASDLQRYAGQYASGEGAEITVKVVDDALVFHMSKTDMPAKPIGKDTFVVSMGSSEAGVMFHSDAQGNVTTMSLGYRAISRVA